jgi:hypothetical protein
MQMDRQAGERGRQRVCRAIEEEIFGGEKQFSDKKWARITILEGNSQGQTIVPEGESDESCERSADTILGGCMGGELSAED